MAAATATCPTVLADWMKISACAGSGRTVRSRRLCVSLAAGPSSGLRAAVRFR